MVTFVSRLQRVKVSLKPDLIVQPSKTLIYVAFWMAGQKSLMVLLRIEIFLATKPSDTFWKATEKVLEGFVKIGGNQSKIVSKKSCILK